MTRLRLAVGEDFSRRVETPCSPAYCLSRVVPRAASGSSPWPFLSICPSHPLGDAGAGLSFSPSQLGDARPCEWAWMAWPAKGQGQRDTFHLGSSPRILPSGFSHYSAWDLHDHYISQCFWRPLLDTCSRLCPSKNL